MTATSYIGNKSNLFQGTLEGGVFFPSLKLSDFQQEMGFEINFSEPRIKQQMLLERWTVNSQLKKLTKCYPDLKAFSLAKFDDEETAEAFYKQAVFTLTAKSLVELQISTDATKGSADRQAVLQEQAERLQAMHRQAIDVLIEPDNGDYTLVVV